MLFDEVEKAHPEVLNLFLQIFDDGRLTDARGRRASFTETVIILTSNLGSGAEALARPIGLVQDGATAKGAEANKEAYRQRIMEAVRRSFRPELLNRLQHVVFFDPLGEVVVRRIIEKILDNLRMRLGERRIHVELTDAAYALLMKEGFDPYFGAREMERAVDRLIVRPLGKALLEGHVAEGTTVRVDVRDGELVLEDAERSHAAHQVGRHRKGKS